MNRLNNDDKLSMLLRDIALDLLAKQPTFTIMDLTRIGYMPSGYRYPMSSFYRNVRKRVFEVGILEDLGIRIVDVKGNKNYFFGYPEGGNRSFSTTTKETIVKDYRGVPGYTIWSANEQDYYTLYKIWLRHGNEVFKIEENKDLIPWTSFLYRVIELAYERKFMWISEDRKTALISDKGMRFLQNQIQYLHPNPGITKLFDTFTIRGPIYGSYPSSRVYPPAGAIDVTVFIKEVQNPMKIFCSRTCFAGPTPFEVSIQEGLARINLDPIARPI